jgi:hypothetical protein
LPDLLIQCVEQTFEPLSVVLRYFGGQDASGVGLGYRANIGDFRQNGDPAAVAELSRL